MDPASQQQQQHHSSQAPDKSTSAVLKPSTALPSDAQEIHGLDFDAHLDSPLTVEDLLASYASTGFQASSLHTAASIIDKMISWRSPSDPSARTTIFLGYTSNLVSSGLRDVIRYLVQHRHVDAIVTTAGGVEEDLIKCLAPTYLGSFSAAGADLRDRGINRIGNLFVPNDNYCRFEDWVVPILDRLLQEQEAARTEAAARNAHAGVTAADAAFEPPFVWSPSRLIERLGRELDDDRSVLTWAARNGVPVFCPALTDGSLGDMLYFHSFRSAPLELTVDIRRDIRRINDLALKAARSGMIVLGGGLVKHHIANANLMRNGAEYAVFVNTGNEFDGSDAGARPDEAVSWGKIKAAKRAKKPAKSKNEGEGNVQKGGGGEQEEDDEEEDGGEAVKVFADASIVFPMLVAATFAKADREARRRQRQGPDRGSSADGRGGKNRPAAASFKVVRPYVRRSPEA